MRQMDEKRKASLDINSLEKNLPFYLWKDIQLLVEGMKNNVSYLDCILDEFEADLKNAIRSNEVTQYQKNYLQKKYLENASEDELRLCFEQTFKC